MTGLRTIAALVLLALAASSAAAQDTSRLDKLEKDLAETKAELERLKQKSGGTTASTEPGGDAPATAAPTAAQQGEKFEKRFGKDALLTWNNGFSLLFLDPAESDPDRRVLHRFNTVGRLQVDYRSYEPDLDEHHPQHDRFFLRRARININGTYWRYHDFYVEFDLGQYSSFITEAWINLGYWKELQVRVGRFKEPFGLEHMTSSRYLNFIERAMPKRWSNVDFDDGAMIHGDLGFLGYQLAVQNGTSTNVPDTNDDKDFNGRVVVTPFRPEPGHFLEHLMLGASLGYGYQTGFVPIYRTEGVDGAANPAGGPSQFLFFPALAATGPAQKGGRYRWSLEGRINIAPITLQAEYQVMTVDDIIHVSGRQVDLTTYGAYVDVLFMITGEEHAYSKRIVPKRNFNPIDGGWGAWQVGVRYDWTHVEDDAREDLGAVGANECNGLVLGLNWYLNPMVKVQFNYNRNWFNRPAANSGERDEDVVMVRVAMEF